MVTLQQIEQTSIAINDIEFQELCIGYLPFLAIAAIYEPSLFTKMEKENIKALLIFFEFPNGRSCENDGNGQYSIFVKGRPWNL